MPSNKEPDPKDKPAAAPPPPPAQKPVENVPKSPEEAKKLRTRGLKPFEKGAKPGPGRPKGSRSARDIYAHIGKLHAPKTILDKLKAMGITPSKKTLDDVIAYATAVRAVSNNGALREYNDRRFDKAMQPIKAGVLKFDAATMSEEVKEIARELGLVDFT